MPYDQGFFDEQRLQAHRSAREIVPIIVDLIQPRSVIDVGCGGGAWLSIFKEHRVREVLGIDGAWAECNTELSPDEFVSYDLTQSIQLNRTFDLVVCLEVAEHLPEPSAQVFVRSLVRLGPVVLFSAAIPLQGGTLHVNEQWPEYWARFFQEHDYVTLDCLRWQIWNNRQVDWWYAQNALLFADRAYIESHPQLSGIQQTGTPDGLRLVHPSNYLDKAKRADIGLADVIKMLGPLAKDAFARRIKRWWEGRSSTS
jgi:SAM-dependent methyltransferase